MTNILILKVDEEGLSEQEGIDIIRQIAENFNLRVTIGDRKRDEDQRFDIMDLFKNHTEDAQASLNKGDLVALVDDDEGIIGYLIQGTEDEVLAHLNGNRNNEVS